MDLGQLSPLQIQAAITSLRLAVAKGVTSLEVNGEKVTYRSLDEILRTIAMLERQLRLGLGGDLPSQNYPAFRRG